MSGILALDQGTTGSKGVLWRDGALTEVGRHAHRQIRPRPGWVEHDPLELLGHLTALLAASGPIAAAGLANQGETVVAWDSLTGRPLHNALVWQDTRTASALDRLRADGVEHLTLERAGLPLDPYFAAGKLRWLLDHADGARDMWRQGRLRLGTSDAFFLHALTGRCVTDVSTASRTSLMHLAELRWDSQLCAAFGVPIDCLPEILPTTGDFGRLRSGGDVVASVVDQQAALFGHGCAEAGDVKITFGTGAFALALCPAMPSAGGMDGLLPTCAWQRGAVPARYALDGGILTAGAAVDWLTQIGLPGDFATIETFTGETALARGIAFVPALAGLGCPHWDRAARGIWLGLDLATRPDDLRRAVLEGIALRAAELVDALRTRLGAVRRLSIDGGLTRSRFFCQFLADAIGQRVEVAASADMTALGTLHLCLDALGDPARPMIGTPRHVHPEATLSQDLRARFRAAVALSRAWGRQTSPAA